LILILNALPGRAGERPPGPPDRPEVKRPAVLSAKPLKIDPKDDALRRLLKERFNHALAEAQARYQAIAAGSGTDEFIFGTAQRVLESGLEVGDTPEARLNLLVQYLELATEVERLIKLKVEAGRASVSELHKARYFRTDAEIRVLREKAKVKAGRD
jgi:hypothetical protein